MTRTALRPLLAAGLAVLVLCACQSAYYATMEKFGVHKREILVDRVAEARDSQQQAKEQFASALERFSAATDFDGGELEETYRRLAAELESSEARAAEVRERIDAVEEVAGALFEEWENELDEYSSDRLRRSSRETLRHTRQRYDRLIRSMRRAEARIEPVLAPMRDQVLYLKHNLNARAIASLRSELDEIRVDVGDLIRDMDAAIREAERFISAMENAPEGA